MAWRTEGRSDDDDHNDYPNEPNFDDPEGYHDNVDDEELFGDILHRKPKDTDCAESVIIVDGIPCVGPDRLPKLKNVVNKIFSKFGEIISEEYPTDGDTTKGFVFVEFKTPQQAHEAVKQTNGYKLDKQHTFTVTLFSEFEKASRVTDDYDPPTVQPYKDPGNLKSWLLDPHCYDQYSVSYEGGSRIALYWNTPNEPTLVEDRKGWTATYIRWSPQGTYMATFHDKGIAFWGGPEMRQIQRFAHPSAQLIDISPCERFLVTFSPVPDSKDDPQSIIIWDVRTGHKRRSFSTANAGGWPMFKWNHDGSYFARMTQDTLSIYETNTFGMLNKKSIKIKDIRDFAWSPTDNILAYWTPEEKETPARVTLIEVPTRETICMKNFFQVAECRMHWQKSGNYLCIKVDRYKARKEEKDSTCKYVGIYHNLNIFRVRERQVPTDVVEIKEPITSFAWEPVGDKFAVIHGEVPRINVSIYNVKQGGTVELLKTFEKIQANHLFWSPNGQFIVMAGLRSMGGIFNFVDTQDMSIMTSGAEHFMATDVEWDPTGRYVATGVSWWGHKMDNAYWIWNFQGKLLLKRNLDRFAQLLWRPSPPSLLTPEHLKELKKKMKSYSTRFTTEDRLRESKASKEQIERRRNMLQEYETWRGRMEQRYGKEKEQRLELRSGQDTDELDTRVENFDEEKIEFLIRVVETPIEE